MNVYFDNASSTKPFSFVLEKYVETANKYFANPASLSNIGFECENVIKNCKKDVSKILNCVYDEIYFTSGATESNNLAIFGTASAYKRNGMHIITTNIEHSSVLEPIKNLEQQGYSITYLNVNEKGLIDLDELKNAIKDDTILVSIMFVNNEIGTVQQIEEIGKIIQTTNSKTLFHVDGVQGFCKHDINVRNCNVHMFSASGHKIHATNGVGILYLKNGLKVKPLIYGGGHQKNMRSGTEDVAGCVSFAEASKYCYLNIDENFKNVSAIKNYIVEQIKDIPDFFVNGCEFGTPYILNVGFKDVRSEVLLRSLEEKGVIVSSGSACHSAKGNGSVLKAIDAPFTNGSIRISFSSSSTISEAEFFTDALKEVIKTLRKYS